VTFGSFNNHRKINDRVLALWAGILQQVPDSRLVLKFPKGADPDLRRYYRDRLNALGIFPGRVGLYGESTYTEHMNLVGQCDILLDTFPYNGARGTMEALWMGVPTVSLVGDTFVSREGLAIQRPVGLEIFTARSEAEYVGKAVSFAGQWESLATIRSSLRMRMLRSPLCDARGWAVRFQEALRLAIDK
jgi:predicted O-linked N-acetylglucosamine transferase (SPINDLY family)